jgi:hypothetical protein
MKQRKAAVDYFFQTHGQLLPEAQRIKRKYYRTLAGDAISLASAAFNAEKMQAAQALCNFARVTYSRISWSLGWAKLACKRRIGHEVWRFLQRGNSNAQAKNPAGAEKASTS